MDKEERRRRIMQILRAEKRVTIVSLSERLGASKRTIQRDLENLSRFEPMYTVVGRYGGGTYLLDDATQKSVRMTQRQIDILNEIVKRDNGNGCYISREEIAELRAFLSWNKEFSGHSL